MQGLEGLRFLYVTGKGGVGKSTVAAALGVRLAKEGRRVLLVSEAGALGQERLLGARPDLHPKQIFPGLYCMAIDSEQAMRQYAESILRSRRLVDLVFHNQVAKGFLAGIPGLSAWAFLGKAWSYADSQGAGIPNEVPGIETVIVDAPATGDSTDILRVPAIIGDLAPRGRFRRDAERCQELLRDPKRAAIIAVTLLEELPVAETEELLGIVRDELKMPLGPLFLNQTRPELFTEQEAEVLASLSPDLEGRPPTEQALALGARRARLEKEARLLTVRLQSLGLPLVRVPHFDPEPSGTARLATLAEGLAEGP
jgi:anion-transporting  ArsA/GET3 family ATPase